MRHIIVSDFGSFIGLSRGLLYIRSKEGKEKRLPLNRVNSVSIAKKGISISSDLIQELSSRGIKLFFLNFKGTAHCSLIGDLRHGVVISKLNQFRYLDSLENRIELSEVFIKSKISNQNSVLKYLNKYHKDENLTLAIQSIDAIKNRLKDSRSIETILGIEGSAAGLYFRSLKKAGLFPPSFSKREKRGATEITNISLNFGYAILSSKILGSIENAGLEPHFGFMHEIRPGKMALVLDLMEEYRAWIVDRAVVKLRSQYINKTELDSNLKRAVIEEINRTLEKKYVYRGKKVMLEHIIQRQVYRFSGHLSGQKKYKPYSFKW